MKRAQRYFLCAAVVFLATAVGQRSAPAAGQPRSVAPPDQLAALDALLASTTSPNRPGCVLGVHDKTVDITRAYGSADLERPAPITVDSVFNIASVSKQFTAAATLLLVSDGRLKLDDDIRKYLPALRRQKRVITIDQLLTHTSGLRDFRFTDWVLGRDTLAQSNQDILDFVARQTALNHAPGESFSYTNTGYVLLAIIAERVSGKTLEQFAEERLFKPAGMVNTHWETDSRQVVPARAAGYAVADRDAEGKPIRFVQLPSARNTYGNGNLLTTIDDMQRWNVALANRTFGDFVSRAIDAPGRLRNGFVLAYARGEMVGTYRGLRQVQHSGYNGNYSAWVARYPDIGLSVSTLCNSDNDDFNPTQVVDLFLPKGTAKEEAATGETKSAATDLSTYSGVYRRVHDGQLADLSFPSDAHLTRGGYTVGPYTYEFPKQRRTRVLRKEYGNVSDWIRLEPWAPATADLSSFVGRFDSSELLGSFAVSRERRALKLKVVGLSSIAAVLEPRARDIFVAHGAPNLDGLLFEFKRDPQGRVTGLAVSPASLHQLLFSKREASVRS